MCVGGGDICLHCILTCKALFLIRAGYVSAGRLAADEEEWNDYVRRSGGSRVQRGPICTPAPAPPTQAPTPTAPVPEPVPGPGPCLQAPPSQPSARPARPPRTRPAPQAKAPPPRSLGGDGERAEEAAPCQPAEGRFSFTCHVVQQMMTLPGSSGSPRPGLSPLTWGWGDRGRGWRRMAPEGGGDGNRGGREAAQAERPAG